MKTILCYGDSNTYGFDPRSCVGSRYDQDDRWPHILGRLAGCTAKNLGLNGRCIPNSPQEYQLLDSYQEADLMIIMLGTNSLLLGIYTREQIIFQMNRLVKHLLEIHPQQKILLLPPPPILLPDVTDQIPILQQAYREIADKYHCLYCNTGNWHIPIAFDGVHISEEGHHLFAKKLYEYLTQTGFFAE